MRKLLLFLLVMCLAAAAYGQFGARFEELGGKVVHATKSSAYTVGTDDVREYLGGIVRVTGTATMTLPDVATAGVGASVCFIAVGAYTITIDPNGADGIILTHVSGTRDTDGDYIQNTSGATGDMICMFADNADGWTTLGSRGTWAQQ